MARLGEVAGQISEKRGAEFKARKGFEKFYAEIAEKITNSNLEESTRKELLGRLEQEKNKTVDASGQNPGAFSSWQEKKSAYEMIQKDFEQASLLGDIKTETVEIGGKEKMNWDEFKGRYKSYGEFIGNGSGKVDYFDENGNWVRFYELNKITGKPVIYDSLLEGKTREVEFAEFDALLGKYRKKTPEDMKRETEDVLKEKEEENQKEKDIASVENFEDLYLIIEKIGTIKSERKEYEAGDVIERIKTAREVFCSSAYLDEYKPGDADKILGSPLIINITRALGIRAKVLELLKKEIEAFAKQGRQRKAGEKKLEADEEKKEKPEDIVDVEFQDALQVEDKNWRGEKAEQLNELHQAVEYARNAYAQSDFKTTNILAKIKNIIPGLSTRKEDLADNAELYGRYKSALNDLLNHELDRIKNNPALTPEQVKKEMGDLAKYFSLDEKFNLYDSRSSARIRSVEKKLETEGAEGIKLDWVSNKYKDFLGWQRNHRVAWMTTSVGMSLLGLGIPRRILGGIMAGVGISGFIKNRQRSKEEKLFEEQKEVMFGGIEGAENPEEKFNVLSGMLEAEISSLDKKLSKERKQELFRNSVGITAGILVGNGYVAHAFRDFAQYTGMDAVIGKVAGSLKEFGSAAWKNIVSSDEIREASKGISALKDKVVENFSGQQSNGVPELDLKSPTAEQPPTTGGVKVAPEDMNAKMPTENTHPSGGNVAEAPRSPEVVDERLKDIAKESQKYSDEIRSKIPSAPNNMNENAVAGAGRVSGTVPREAIGSDISNDKIPHGWKEKTLNVEKYHTGKSAGTFEGTIKKYLIEDQKMGKTEAGRMATLMRQEWEKLHPDQRHYNLVHQGDKLRIGVDADGKPHVAGFEKAGKVSGVKSAPLEHGPKSGVTHHEAAKVKSHATVEKSISEKQHGAGSHEHRGAKAGPDSEKVKENISRRHSRIIDGAEDQKPRAGKHSAMPSEKDLKGEKLKAGHVQETKIKGTAAENAPEKSPVSPQEAPTAKETIKRLAEKYSINPNDNLNDTALKMMYRASLNDGSAQNWETTKNLWEDMNNRTFSEVKSKMNNVVLYENLKAMKKDYLKVLTEKFGKEYDFSPRKDETVGNWIGRTSKLLKVDPENDKVKEYLKSLLKSKK